MTEPLRHVMRTPLPWREATHTVCGRLAAEFAVGLVLSLDEARVLAGRLGKQRFAMMICMTCANHVGSWPKWEDDPLGRMAREVSGGGFGRVDPLVTNELRAIAALIELHRDDFDELLSSFTSGEVTTIGELRARRSRGGG